MVPQNRLMMTKLTLWSPLVMALALFLLLLMQHCPLRMTSILQLVPQESPHKRLNLTMQKWILQLAFLPLLLVITMVHLPQTMNLLQTQLKNLQRRLHTLRLMRTPKTLP